MYWSFSSVQMSLTTADIANAAQMWYDEVTYFDPAQVTKFSGAGLQNEVIGHYTQVVWATSFSVACGTSVCKDSSSSYASWPYIYTVACNYEGPGNYLNNPVY